MTETTERDEGVCSVRGEVCGSMTLVGVVGLICLTTSIIHNPSFWCLLLSITTPLAMWAIGMMCGESINENKSESIQANHVAVDIPDKTPTPHDSPSIREEERP